MKGEEPFMPRGPVFMLDTMWAGAGGPPNPALLARNAYIEMMQTAQNVADRYRLTREEIDAFALRSHQHAAAARDSGRLAAEIDPVEIPATRKQPARLFEHDESIRADTTAEKLAALAPQPNTTQMTAGNSSPLNDGASAVALASAAAAEELGVEPLARVVSSATHALDPQIMGIAPAFAIPKALVRAGLAAEDVGVWEIHEAYAAQALGVLRELPRQLDGFQVPDERLNPNGGAVAIGHPFGPQPPGTCSRSRPSCICAKSAMECWVCASVQDRGSRSCSKTQRWRSDERHAGKRPGVEMTQRKDFRAPLALPGTLGAWTISRSSAASRRWSMRSTRSSLASRMTLCVSRRSRPIVSA